MGAQDRHACRVPLDWTWRGAKFHQEILANPAVNKRAAKLAIKRAVKKRGVSENTALLAYGYRGDW